MESRFDTNDFERSLREQADKFYLIPSERVWKSIYNDLHPGSKWPSLGVGIILLISLFWIGNTHTSTVNPNTLRVVQKNSASAYKDESATAISSSSTVHLQPGTVQQFNNQKIVAEQTVSLPIAAKILKRNNESLPEGTVLDAGNVGSQNNQSLSLQQVINIPALSTGIHARISPKSLADVNKILNRRSNPEMSDQLQKVISTFVSRGAETESERFLPAKTQVVKSKKTKRKADWALFVTPQRSYVHFKGTNLNEPPVQSLVATSPNTVHKMNTTGRFGLQAGVDVNYKLTRSIDFTSGFHLSYNGYNIIAELAHPSLASVTFRDSKGNLFTKNYMSYYGNSNNGSLKITNYNMQFAIPVGLQWTLFEEDNVKVSVVSTVEPYLVLGSQAYILAGDGKKFVNDPDLIRRVNLNGTFGSVVTFSSHKINWNIGPSIRYQVLSTYQNIYPIREHLINYGLRIGISKPM